MAAWVLIVVAVLGSYLLVRHFIGGFALAYLAAVCWLLWRKRFEVAGFARRFQSKMDAFDEAEIPHRKAPKRPSDPSPQSTREYAKKLSRRTGYSISLPDWTPPPSRPQDPVLTKRFLARELGTMKDDSTALPLWFKKSGKRSSDLMRLTPKEFETYAVMNHYNERGTTTVGQLIRSDLEYETMTGDAFVNNWLALEKSGKAAQLDKAAPRLSPEWLRAFYRLQPKSVRQVFTEEQFVERRSLVETGLQEHERQVNQMIHDTIHMNDDGRYDREIQKRNEAERRRKQEDAEFRAKWDKIHADERKWQQRYEEQYEVNKLANDLWQKGLYNESVELQNNYARHRLEEDDD